MSTSVCVCVCMCVYTCVFVRVYIPVCLCVYIYLCVCDIILKIDDKKINYLGASPGPSFLNIISRSVVYREDNFGRNLMARALPGRHIIPF
jgi:hypothetical protein